jgi:hypothetical protein
MTNRRLDRTTWILAAVAVFVIYGTLLLLRPAYFLRDDNATFFLPQYVFNARAVAEDGRLPLVNFHQYLGTPYLANGQSAVLYPGIYLAVGCAEILFGDPRHTMDILALLHLTAAAAAMALLLRALGTSRWVAGLGGVLWATFPFLPEVGRNWIIVTYTAMILPLLLLCLERLIRSPTIFRAATLAAVMTLYLFQGYVQYPLLASLLNGVYLIARWILDHDARTLWRAQLTALAAAFVGTLFLTAPLLLPMLQAKTVSSYRTGPLSYDEFLSNAMPLDAFFKAQIFHMAPQVIHQSNGSIFYVGAPILLALLAVFLFRRQPEAAPFLAAGCAAAVAFLCTTQAYGLVYGVPLLSSFRWPFKSFLLFLAFATVAAAGTCDLLRRRRPRLGTALVLLFFGGAIATNLAVIFNPKNDLPFGPNGLERDVADLVAETHARLPLAEDGRVVSLWLSPGEPRISRFLVFNFSTLAQTYHLGGYDPLVSRQHRKLAMGLEFSNIFRWGLTRKALDHLSAWSVRYLLVPEDDRLRPLLTAWPRLRLLSTKDGFEVWENPAALPIASFIEDPYHPVPHIWSTNEIRVYPQGQSGALRLTLASLPEYRASVDGRPATLAEDPRQRLVVNVPPGTEEVVVLYVSSRFRLGTGLALIAVLTFCAAWYRLKQGHREHRPSRI